MFGKAIIGAGIALGLLLGWNARGGEALPASLRPIVEHVQTNRDGRAAWSIDFAALEGDQSSLPIGVFDSGIGGLTVLEAILQLDAFNNETLRPGADGRPDFAGERFIYFGDQANMPYGNYSAQGQERFLRELILKDAIFLMGSRWRTSPESEPRYDKPPVKAIVIACNTATAYGLEDIRAALAEWKINVPVIGVVEAAARDVAAALPKEGKPGTVAVLATVGTCSSEAYPKAIRRSAGQGGKAAPEVVQQGSVGLAGAIDGNAAFITGETGKASVRYLGPGRNNPDARIDPAFWQAYRFEPGGLLGGAGDPRLNSVPNYVRYDVVTLLERHRGGEPIDTVVLGCTHFPLAREEIAKTFESARTAYGKRLAKDLRFIDPSQSVARELFVEIARARIRNKTSAGSSGCQFFFSVPNRRAKGARLAADNSLAQEYKAGRKTGQLNVEDTVVVPLTVESLPGSSTRLVQALPAVWKELTK